MYGWYEDVYVCMYVCMYVYHKGNFTRHLRTQNDLLGILILYPRKFKFDVVRRENEVILYVVSLFIKVVERERERERESLQNGKTC